MWTERRRCLHWLGALPLLGAGLAKAQTPAAAPGETLARVREKGRLRIAVYNDFAPYSSRAGQGIDADLGRAIAAKLGVAAEIVGFNADEDMNDDLRNMVWKGHYLGTQPADVMMHVPVDEHLIRANDKVRIFGAYHREQLALARDPARVPPLAGSAAVALEIFTREKIGVETASLADSFLLAVMNGRLRDNVVHFKSVGEAASGLLGGQVAAVLAPRAELEAALTGQTGIALELPRFAELTLKGWLLGMAVKRDDQDLADALAAALEALKREGEIARIFRQHGITHLPA